jgi:hypothetical protein
MNIMPELNRLFGGLLGEKNPISENAEQSQGADQHCNQPGWLTEPIQKITDHAYSCGKISSFRTFATQSFSLQMLAFPSTTGNGS